MDNLTERMLYEAVKFLEICQVQALNEKISLSTYYDMTKVKFEFIEKILRKQSNSLPSDKEFLAKLNKLRLSNLFICSVLDEVCA
jgi:hypothetical protein